MILMHKNIKVAVVEMYEGMIAGLSEIFNYGHMPFGAKDPYIDMKFEKWYEARSIPSNRQGVVVISEALANSISIVKTSQGAPSLTDCYWVREDNADTLWEDVDFRRKGFSGCLSKAILGNGEVTKGEAKECRTPDLTTDGAFKKTWKIIGGRPCLVKLGSTEDWKRDVESANEVVAYRVAKMLGINAVEYRPVRLASGETACACPCFINDDHHELVNGVQIMEHAGRFGEDLYKYLCRKGLKKGLDGMIILDYIMHNTDRHEGNFGIIRDPDTLEWLSFAPIYDTGSCLGHDCEPGISPTEEAGPFASDRNSQVALAGGIPDDVPAAEDIISVIEKVYEIFGIKEQMRDIAAEDVRHTYDMISKKLWEGVGYVEPIGLYG